MTVAVVLSERIAERVKMVRSVPAHMFAPAVLTTFQCEIRDEIYGASDHCPVVMDIEASVL